MANIPALCLNCQTIFESIVEIDGGPLTMINCRTNCPDCGGDASILDGTYSTVGSALKLLRGSTFTRTQVEALNSIRRSMAAKNPPKNSPIPEDVAEAISAITPELGAAIKLLQKGKANWAVVMLLLYLLLCKCEAEDGSPIIDASTHIQVTRTYNLAPAPPQNVMPLPPPAPPPVYPNRHARRASKAREVR